MGHHRYSKENWNQADRAQTLVGEFVEVDSSIKTLLLTIAQSLVDKPEKVTVNQLQSEQAFIFELQVAKEDIGKIIGRGGKTAMALRSILEAASGKYKKRVILEILE